MTNLQAYTIKETGWITLLVLPKNKYSLMAFFQYLSGRGIISMYIVDKKIEGIEKFAIRLQIPETELEKIVAYINKNTPIT